MANTSSSAATAANNPHSFVSSEAPSVVGGVVMHPHISALTQVRILSLVDETGSASIGEIVAALSTQEDPVSALLALVGAGVLELVLHGVLDEHTVVRRTSRDPDPDGAQASAPVAPVLPDLLASAATELGDVPEGVECLGGNPFHAHVTISSGENRRALGQAPELHRPGIYLLISATSVYVGYSSSVGGRVAAGTQLIEDVQTVCVITDVFDNLTPEQALIGERNLYARVCAAGEREVVNEVPIGGPCDSTLFGQIDLFVGEAALMLHNHDVFFRKGTPRSVLVGPRAGPGRIGPGRLFDAQPNGELVELSFGSGLVTHAVKQPDDRWLLLEGSDVRLDAAPSGNRSIHYSRAQWLHSGLLALAPDGRSLVTTRDLYFQNGSSAAQLCTGAKGRPLSAWRQIGLDDEAPETLSLAA